MIFRMLIKTKILENAFLLSILRCCMYTSYLINVNCKCYKFRALNLMIHRQRYMYRRINDKRSNGGTLAQIYLCQDAPITTDPPYVDNMMGCNTSIGGQHAVNDLILMVFKHIYLNGPKIVSESGQEISQSQTENKPIAPHNYHETPGRQTKQSNQLSLPHQDDCKTRMDIK